MPALNFKPEFAPDVESEKKRQTIRKIRNRPIKVGDMLYLKTGMRTKHCRALGQAPCRLVQLIRITEYDIRIEGMLLTTWGMLSLAVADGFPRTKPFIDFFREQYGLPFEGVIIHWGDLRIRELPNVPTS